MNKKAIEIIDVINEVTVMEDVQPGFPDANGNTNVTWCNRALYRILTWLNGKAELICEPRGISWTNANSMVVNARKNLFKVIDGKIAQSRANIGELVIAVALNHNGSGHVALVCPDLEIYSEQVGARIGQAGLKNGIMYANQGFAHLFPIVEYYLVPLNENGCSA